MSKAMALRREMRAYIDVEDGNWTVISPRTGEAYRVYRILYHSFVPDTWWEEFGCTCMAGEKGWTACYHKAYVKLLVEEGVGTLR